MNVCQRGFDELYLGSAEFSADGGGSSGHEDSDGQQSLDTEDCHRESQAENKYQS